jgi:predicted nucleic acid-binding protein
MSDRIFVDSNVWIYLFTSDEVSKNLLPKICKTGN